jgi:hypothetical protein
MGGTVIIGPGFLQLAQIDNNPLKILTLVWVALSSVISTPTFQLFHPGIRKYSEIFDQKTIFSKQPYAFRFPGEEALLFLEDFWLILEYFSPYSPT